MYTNKRILKDKSIIVLSVVSVMALSGLVASIMLSDNNDNPGISQIAELDETTAAPLDKNDNSSTEGQDAAAKVKKETETPAETVEQKPEKSTEQTSEASSQNGQDTENSKDTSPVSDENGASVNAPASSLSFTADSILVWPVETNDIIIDYSMDATTYFATLDMYKTSDAVSIRSDINSPVYAAADGIITANSYNEEIGHFISMDLGNNYELTYGQLKDIQVDEGTAVSVGDLIGYVSEPTKYYTVEGANLYLKMTCEGAPTDPLNYLNFGEE